MDSSRVVLRVGLAECSLWIFCEPVKHDEPLHGLAEYFPIQGKRTAKGEQAGLAKAAFPEVSR